MNNKLLIIGLDGATFNIIDPLLEKGELPFINKLVKNGVKVPLLSTIPYATIPAWPSFMTGMNPGKHGVFDFFEENKEGKRIIVNSNSLKVKSLWDILSDFGKKSIIVNVPCTYPPKKIKGIIVSGMLSSGDNYIEPGELKKELNQISDGYRINEDADLWDKEELIDDLREVTEKQKTAFLYFLKRKEWDFAMIMFRGTDVIQHKFWDQKDVIKVFYQYMDSVIGEIFSTFPNSYKFIMSDHGFQAQRKDFHPNRWLIDEGYLKVKRGREIEKWNEIGKLEGRDELAKKTTSIKNIILDNLLSNIGFTKNNMRRFLPNYFLDYVRKFIPNKIKNRIPEKKDFQVDWDNSVASAFQNFTMETKSIVINRKYIDKMNFYDSNYNELVDEIRKKISSIKDPYTGKKIVKNAYTREDLFKGPYVEKAPDIILDLESGYNVSNSFINPDYVTKRREIRGCHEREGIFIAFGDELISDKNIENDIYLWDIVPTLLHILNIPIPENCDGRVLREIFREDSFLKDKKEKRMKMDPPIHEQVSEEDELRKEEIKRRLGDLGYI